MTFGDYIREKREEMKMSIRTAAKQLNCSGAYLFDIEKNNRLPFSDPEKLEQLGDVLKLSISEREKMYDLAGEEREEIPKDLAHYVKERPWIIQAIRRSKKKNASEKDWNAFLG